MSKIGCDAKARDMPKTGSGTEAAIAPPTNACAVAVIFTVYPVYQYLSKGFKLWKPLYTPGVSKDLDIQQDSLFPQVPMGKT